MTWVVKLSPGAQRTGGIRGGVGQRKLTDEGANVNEAALSSAADMWVIAKEMERIPDSG